MTDLMKGVLLFGGLLFAGSAFKKKKPKNGNGARPAVEFGDDIESTLDTYQPGERDPEEEGSRPEALDAIINRFRQIPEALESVLPSSLPASPEEEARRMSAATAAIADFELPDGSSLTAKGVAKEVYLNAGGKDEAFLKEIDAWTEADFEESVFAHGGL